MGKCRRRKLPESLAPHPPAHTDGLQKNSGVGHGPRGPDSISPTLPGAGNLGSPARPTCPLHHHLRGGGCRYKWTDPRAFLRTGSSLPPPRSPPPAPGSCHSQQSPSRLPRQCRKAGSPSVTVGALQPGPVGKTSTTQDPAWPPLMGLGQHSPVGPVG